jgi:hypothetical protein
LNFNVSEPSLTRRGFIGGALAVGVGLTAAGLSGCVQSGSAEDASAGDFAEESASTDGARQPTGAATGEDQTDETSTVFVQRNTDGTDDGVRRLIALMETKGVPFYRSDTAPQGLVAADDVVILKINCQWAQRGGTNTDLLEQVALAIAAHPSGFSGEVIVADNGQAQYGSAGGGGSLDWDETNAADRRRSARDVVEALRGQMRISGSLWDDFTMRQADEFSEGDTDDGFVIENETRSTGIVISYPKFTSAYGTQVSFREGVWDAASGSYDTSRLKVINLSVLKVHGLYQVTGAVKAYMGTTASRLTGQAAHNSVGKGGMGTQLAQTRMPTLNIMDMIWVGVSRGPGISYDNAVEANMLAASVDPVALDWRSARNVLIPQLEARGVDTRSVDPDGQEQGSFGYWLGLTAEELRGAGIVANRGDAVRVEE